MLFRLLITKLFPDTSNLRKPSNNNMRLDGYKYFYIFKSYYTRKYKKFLMFSQKPQYTLKTKQIKFNNIYKSIQFKLIRQQITI